MEDRIDIASWLAMARTNLVAKNDSTEWPENHFLPECYIKKDCKEAAANNSSRIIVSLTI